MLKHIVNNPYRVLGVLSNSPIKDRIANQNKLNAFVRIGKEVEFPNDFIAIIPTKPTRTEESLSEANKSINLDKDQVKSALFWFIAGSPIDSIALKHLQTGNIEKAKEIFQKKETFASLINSSVVAFIEKDIATGFTNILKVIHSSEYRSDLLNALGVANINISENELSELFITELLKEVSAKKLLSAASDPSDKAIISKIALEKPMAQIDSALSIAKATDTKDANANLEAGTKLMNSTQKSLKEVKSIAGSRSPQYQMVADNIAKQVLQCSINYYNNASDLDVESPRKALELLTYALSIAVGKLTKDRCQENFDVLKKTVDNMPPLEVAFEARKVQEELRKFCKLPDKIVHAVTLLNNTKPLLQTIKRRLGESNSFYLSLSTQVVSNALHNIIEEVNQAQNAFGRMIEECKLRGINPSLVGSTLLDNIKPVMQEAWQATLLMDSFDLEYEFKTKHYNPNRQALKEMCDDLNISTPTSTSSTFTTKPSRPTPVTPSPVTSVIILIICAICVIISVVYDNAIPFIGAVILWLIYGFLTKE